MRLGLTLPTFTSDGTLTVRAARAAEAAGLDGVFVFDHLWPLGSPERPALSGLPILAAVAAATAAVAVGTLVARVGLLDDEHLFDAITTIAAVAGTSRVIAGLGAGDRLSSAENLAYGLGFPPSSDRLAAVADMADRLGRVNVTTWIGGRSPAARVVAANHANALNSWGSDESDLAAEAAHVRSHAGRREVGVTWGGQVLIGADAADTAARLASHGSRPGLVHGTVAEVAAALRRRDAAAGGLDWAVCAPLDVGVEPDAAIENLAGVRRALALA